MHTCQLLAGPCQCKNLNTGRLMLLSSFGVPAACNLPLLGCTLRQCGSQLTTPDQPKATTRHLLLVGATSYRYLHATARGQQPNSEVRLCFLQPFRFRCPQFRTGPRRLWVGSSHESVDS
jgi:hypothetical protein